MIFDFNATMRRGLSALISLAVTTSIPSREIECRLATIPMIVAMQAARAVATKSVGEKLSPLPSLSTGASVSNLRPEGPCTAEQCNCPSYRTVILTKGNPAQPCPPPGERAQAAAPPKRNMIPEPAAAPSNTLSNSRVMARRCPCRARAVPSFNCAF